MSNTATCLNCQLTLKEEDNFCNFCGQSSATHRFNFGHILHEFFHAFTHTDKTVLGLIAGMISRPGKLVGEYLDGKRKKYFNPFTFLLLVAAFSLVILNITGTFQSSGNSSVKAGNHRATAPADRAAPADPSSLAMMERAQKVSKFMAKRQNLVMIIAVPFNALVFFLFYRRSGRNYAEHLVANVFFVAFVVLFSSLLFYPLLAWFKRPPGMYVILLLMLISHCAYYAYGYGQLLKCTSWKNWLGVILASIASIALWSLLTRFLIGWYIRGW